MHSIAKRYVVRSILSDGEWARVYIADDTKLGVPRVVKIIHEEFAHHRGLLRRLRNEAQAMAQIQHPNVLRINDIAEVDGRVFLVTEYHPEGSLADLLERSGPLPVDEGLGLMLEVLDALTAVHALGVIHRDLKPANILLSDAGRPILADFGIATSVDVELRSTGVGGLLGTFAYMAPEQRLRSSEATEVVDVYGAAATLFELITGNSPMDLFAAAPDSPRLSELPAPLREVIFRATRYKPKERTPSVAAFAEELRAAQLALAPTVEVVEEPGALIDEDMLALYKRSLISYRDRVQRARERLTDDPGVAIEELRSVAHRVHGSAGSFGYAQLSELAAALHDAAPVGISSAAQRFIDGLEGVIAETPAQRSRTIGVVVADPLLVYTLRDTLERAGHDVVVASDMEMFEELERTQRVDLVICELLGREDPLLEWLTERSEVPVTLATPTIVLGTDYAVESAALACGAARFLCLPLDLVALVAGVESILARPDHEVRLDHASGLLDHTSFLHAVVKARQASRGGCVALINFTWEGDAEGRFGLDLQCVEQLKHRLAEARSPAPVLGRWGPGAVGVLLPERGATEAVTELERLLAGISGEVASGVVKLTAGLAQLGAESIGRAMRLAEEEARRSRVCPPGRVLGSGDGLTLVRRVMLVDDDEIIGAVVGSVLDGEGIEVYQRYDARELVHHTLRYNPALVILDVEMPGVDGFKALELLRSQRQLRDLPVLMLTSKTAENDVVLGLEMGADDYMAKPLRPAELRARVRRLLRATA